MMLSELEVEWAKATMARMVASGRVKVAAPLADSQVKTILNGHAHERQRGPARRRVMRSRAAVERRRVAARLRMRELRAKNSSIGKIRARAAAGGTFTWKDFPQMSRGLAGRLIRRLGKLGELVMVKSGRPGRSSGEASVWRKADVKVSDAPDSAAPNRE